MIYRLTSTRNDGFTLVADYNKLDDALARKKVFEIWDSLKPKTPPHKVEIHELTEETYSLLLQQEKDFWNEQE